MKVLGLHALQVGHVFPGNKYTNIFPENWHWAGMFSWSKLAFFGLSGGVRVTIQSNVWSPALGFTVGWGGVEESKLLSRRHFWILQGEHDRNYQRSKSQNSENDDSCAFYEANTHATFKGRGITNPKTTTAMHFTRSTSLLL